MLHSNEPNTIGMTYTVYFYFVCLLYLRGHSQASLRVKRCHIRGTLLFYVLTFDITVATFPHLSFIFGVPKLFDATPRAGVHESCNDARKEKL